MASNSAPSGSFNHSSVPFQRQFVSAQSRYDNMRARESDVHHRLCRECGRIIQGEDLVYQHHIISHEAAFLCYQIYHFEKGNTLPDGYFGQSKTKIARDRVPGGSKQKKLKASRLAQSSHGHTGQSININAKKKPKKSIRDAILKQLQLSSQPIPSIKRKSETPAGVIPPKMPKFSTSLKATTSFIDEKPVKPELNLSEDESETSNITESDPDEIELPVDDDCEEEKLETQDPDDIDYVPTQSTSARGRPRKPALLNDLFTQ